MKIGVTGFEGQIGTRLVKYGCVPLRCDVTDPNSVEQAIEGERPDVILHLAAMTSVDWCQKNYEEATAVNTFGTSVVCGKAEKIIGAGRVVLISSDQVFDGNSGNYSEKDDPNPVNHYGLTKFGAEAVAILYGVKIIRISRSFDMKSKDIIDYMDKVCVGEEVHVPDFFYRSYCHMDFIAEAFLEYARRFDQMPDFLHIAGNKSISFHSLITGIASAYGLNLDLIKQRGEEPGHTPRPYKTGLNVSRALRLRLPIYSIQESINRLLYEK